MNEKEIVRVLELTVSLTDKLAAKDAEIAALCKVVENLEAENQRLKAMVHVAEETGVEFCELEDGGVGCAIPMTEELRDALESSVALTDKCRAKDAEIATLRKVAETANVLVYRLVDIGDWWYKSELDPVRAALKELEEERRG